MTDIVQQAAEWLVKLSAEDPLPTEQELAEFHLWKASDPRHLKAVSRMEGFVGQLHNLSSTASHAALNQVNKNESWNSLTKLLSLLVFVCLPLWLLIPHNQFTSLLADKHTESGQLESYILEDNSRLTLNSHSAVNLKFDEHKRVIELLHGQILIDVAHDNVRPLVVKTNDGSFTALGTRFVVQREKNKTVLTVLESKVSAHAAFELRKTHGHIVMPGQRLSIYAAHIGEIEIIDPKAFEQSWLKQKLVIQDRPLSEVLDQLSHHHPAYFNFNKSELSQLRVSAVLPLDKPEQALQLLSESLPISISKFSPWLVSIKKKNNN